jgi:2-methylisocitrate lyase-like PEP mutase family enzyme
MQGLIYQRVGGALKMSKRSQKEKAEALLSLHRDGGLLVLPNIWDPIGARILEAKGYPAVATASAAVSAALGYQDGENINRSTLIDILGRIARSVDVPVTADIETGYGESLSELELTAQQVLRLTYLAPRPPLQFPYCGRSESIESVSVHSCSVRV